MGYGFVSGGLVYAQSHPTKPTGLKVAATDTNFDFKITENAILATISVKDPNEFINGTEVAIHMRSSTGKVLHDLPEGQCGHDSVYYWDGAIPVPENSILRVVLNGVSATRPRIRVSILKGDKHEV